MSSIGQGSISIDDSTRIGENAQDTANKVAGNVNDINSDNKLTPTEKLKLKQEYDKDLKLYAIDVSQLQSAGIPTTELDSALSNLTNFVTPLFKEMNRTSTVDRNALDSVFTAFATADKNSSQVFVNMVQQVADDAKKAGSDAKEVGKKAQEAGEEAKAAADQAKVDAATAQQKAQSSIDQLTVVDSKVTKLSTSTTARFNTLNNGYQEVISTVNNMDISGRNYILNSDFYITSGNKNVLSSVEPNEYSGKKITVSVDIEINNLKTIADSGHTRVGYEAAFHASDNSTVYVGVWKNLTKSDIGKSFKYRAINNTYDLTKKTIISINDGNRALGGVYIQGITADSIKVGHPKLEIATKATDWSPAPEDFASQTDITASIGNINLGVKNADGSTATFNMNSNTILLDANKIIFNGKTSILDASIDTAKIANAAINTAQIADGAINNAKIANASIDDAKINSLNGNKLVENSITANKINVNDLIANGINTKTLTSINLNTSTITTPKLDLGFNGTFTEDFDYTQATTMFLPKKNKGTLTFNHGVLQSKGNMQTYVGGKWGGMNDNYTFQAGIDNSQWTEVAPGYIKLDLFNQNNPDMVERTYVDATGYYYKSGNGIASYLGNVLQTSQVQTPSVIGKYIGPSAGVNLLQIGNIGKDFGFQVGSYYGGEAVLSDFIYSATSSHSPDVHITENGRLVRTTSASKYKYNIKNPDIETTLGDRLLNVHLATWNDKCAVDSYAEQLSTGEEREKSSIDEYYGLIAEQLRDAGLDMFISYGKNHEIEGIQYDRAWVPLLSVIRRLNDKVNEYELRLSKLEGANK
ncbi:hypothetical protein ITQ99_04590 [Pediococcus pentosaceus]|uniref:hypothetical protein n=1 Tax=Pediococcus pentosaceus TaxID=1255 RepID=UPI0018A18C94|nr:hypothetical protein [Pediococcus pentosaceus]MBF7107959.1 hypothetical protein [Pediococcus pentosaceus]